MKRKNEFKVEFKIGGGKDPGKDSKKDDKDKKKKKKDGFEGFDGEPKYQFGFFGVLAAIALSYIYENSFGMDFGESATMNTFLNVSTARWYNFPSHRCRIGPHCSIGSPNGLLES